MWPVFVGPGSTGSSQNSFEPLELEELISAHHCMYYLVSTDTCDGAIKSVTPAVYNIVQDVLYMSVLVLCDAIYLIYFIKFIVHTESWSYDRSRFMDSRLIVILRSLVPMSS